MKKFRMDEEIKKGYREAFVNSMEVHEVANSMIQARGNYEARKSARKLIVDSIHASYDEYHETYDSDKLSEVYIWEMMGRALSSALSYGSTIDEVIELIVDAYMVKFLWLTAKHKGNYEKAYMLMTASTYDHNPIRIDIA